MRNGKDGSSGLPDMKLTPFAIMASALFASSLYAAEIRGTVLDPFQQPIAGATVAAVNDVGVIVQQITDGQGHYDFNVSPLFESYQLRVAAPGFQMVTVGAGVAMITLSIAPQSESVRVTGSAIDVPADQQGTSTSVVTSGELRDRNEAQALDVM